jgi:signal transduction histidine kinase
VPFRSLAKRDLIIQISQEIRALNRSALEQQRTDVSAVYRVVQRRALGQLAAAALLSVVIALLVTRSASKLEAGIREQVARQTQSRQDLQRLSTRLIHAQEEERRTIARELHDELGQALTAIKLELSAAQRNDDTGSSLAEALSAARTITDDAIHKVRDLSQLLHPAVLDDLGLTIAVDRYLHAFTSRTGVQTELIQERMKERLSPEIETSIYRIVQEATTNVARHSRATLCRVYLQHLPQSLLVTIEDDGQGFDSAELEARGTHRGLGLLGIQERAAVLQGTCRVESSQGRGTRISVELPVLPALAAAPERDHSQPQAT